MNEVSILMNESYDLASATSGAEEMSAVYTSPGKSAS